MDSQGKPVDQLTVKELRPLARQRFGPNSWIWDAHKADLIHALQQGQLPDSAKTTVKPRKKTANAAPSKPGTVQALRAAARQRFGPSGWIWKAKKADLIQALDADTLPDSAKAKAKPTVDVVVTPAQPASPAPKQTASPVRARGFTPQPQRQSQAHPDATANKTLALKLRDVTATNNSLNATVADLAAQLDDLRAQLSAANAQIAQLKAAPATPPVQHKRLKTTGPRRIRRRASTQLRTPVVPSQDITLQSQVDVPTVDVPQGVTITTPAPVVVQVVPPAVPQVSDPWDTVSDPWATSLLDKAWATPRVNRVQPLLPASTVLADVQAIRAVAQAAKARATARTARADTKAAKVVAQADAWSKAAVQTKRWMKAKASARLARQAADARTAAADARFAHAWNLAGKVSARR